MRTPILELSDVNKNFNDFTAVKNVNLKINEGEFVCVIGPSGCGKTVLLYLIAGFLKPTSGNIEMNGQPVNSIETNRLMVFQDHMLFPWKTVHGNVMFGLSNSTLNNQEKEKLVTYYLDMVGLAQFKNWPIYKLSGGMKQRVAFARSLVVNPSILLMDEPFSALDSQNRKILRKNLIEIWQKTKKTVIFVTHSINEAIHLADTIYTVSARPLTIKNVYPVKTLRPRDMGEPELRILLKNIEDDIEEEFNKTISLPSTELNLNRNLITSDL